MQKIDSHELWVTRLLVFLETSPQSDTYHQVILNPEQFKAVSDAIAEVLSTQGDMETINIELSAETYKLPDLQEIYIKE